MNQDLLKSNQKILIVDDHELILAGTLNLLKDQGLENNCLAVKTVQDALLKMQEFKFKGSLGHGVEKV